MQPSYGFPSSSGSASNYSAGPSGWEPPPSPFGNEPNQTSEAQHLYRSQQGPSYDKNKGGYVLPDFLPDESHLPDLHIAISQETQTSYGSFSHLQSVDSTFELDPTHESFYQNQFWNNPPVIRKRPVRAQQACESCRTRKAKCDEKRPCGNCRENSLECIYREIPPHKQDKNALALEAKLDNLQREMSNMQRETNDKLDRLLQLYESLLKKSIQTTTSQNPAI
jgi:Fungal Zn(2)-Cys(6) binuclear cluster domain